MLPKNGKGEGMKKEKLQLVKDVLKESLTEALNEIEEAKADKERSKWSNRLLFVLMASTGAALAIPGYCLATTPVWFFGLAMCGLGFGFIGFCLGLICAGGDDIYTK